MTSINIIGHGYVGGALANLCHINDISFNVFDVIEKETQATFFTTNLKRLVLEAEKKPISVYFICVPTPSKLDGSCNTDIVDGILSELNSMVKNNSYVIIKSTLVPGSCNLFSKKYKNLCVVSCPEFLKEDNFKQDFYDSKFVLIGLENSNMSHSIFLTKLFQSLFSHNNSIKIVVASYKECEMFKYSLNVYLAVKIWYFNEVYDICNSLGVDYQNLKKLFDLDPRIGNYGITVPGPDGKFGYGKGCLPKETRGMAYLQKSLKIDNSILKQIIQRNDFFRNL